MPAKTAHKYHSGSSNKMRDEANNIMPFKARLCEVVPDDGLSSSYKNRVVKTYNSADRRDDKASFFSGILEESDDTLWDRVPPLDKLKGYLRKDFPALDDKTVAYVCRVVEKSLINEFTPPVEREPSIYDQKREDESLEEFIRRKYKEHTGKSLPSTYKAKTDGECIDFIKKHFQQPEMNFIDGIFFSRIVLAKLNKQLARRLRNWLTYKDVETGNKNILPEDLPLPKDSEVTNLYASDLTKKQINAALSINQRIFRQK